MKRLALALGLWLALASLALAQNPTCPTRPPGDTTNACASTAFVGAAIASIPNTAITALTGDGTATGPGSVPFTLATVNGNVGSFGSATQCLTVTTNAKGLITAASVTTCTPAIGSITGFGTSVASILANPASVAGGLAQTVASGSTALGTGAITSATCATVVTAAATNTGTTDVVTASFNSDPSAVTGYIPLTSGMLTILVYPTANNVNFKVCNNTSGSITPGAITLNWRVVR